MSHCRLESVSVAATSALRLRVPPAGPLRSRSETGAVRSGPALPIGRFRAAPTSARWAAASRMKSALRDRTVATPTCAFSLRIVPPAVRTAARAWARLAPGAYFTT
jgi:hypothetical protein